MLAERLTNAALDGALILASSPPEPNCDDEACVMGEIAHCADNGMVSNGCLETGGTCATPGNREPGVMCGGTSVGFCAQRRNASVVNAPCQCESGYTGDGCGECAPGFYAVEWPAWGDAAQRCVRMPPDIAAQIVPASAADPNDRGLLLSKVDTSSSGLSGGAIAGIVITCVLIAAAAVVAAAVIAAKRRREPPPPDFESMALDGNGDGADEAGPSGAPEQSDLSLTMPQEVLQRRLQGPEREASAGQPS